MWKLSYVSIILIITQLVSIVTLTAITLEGREAENLGWLEGQRCWKLEGQKCTVVSVEGLTGYKVISTITGNN